MDDKNAKPESIRQWYERTTRKARKAFVWATVFSLAVMVAMWVVAPMTTLGKLQTFNGALTVPLIGGLWIFAFIFMFLIPSREASFRAQETVEGAVAIMKKAVDENLIPVLKIWERVGLQVEKEYPELKKRVEESLAELKETSKKVEKALEGNASFVEEARPVLQALKRIEERFDEDVLDDLKLAAQAVQRMGGMPAFKPAPAAPAAPAAAAPSSVPPTPGLPEIPSEKEPNLGIALASIGKRKEKKAASSQPQ